MKKKKPIGKVVGIRFEEPLLLRIKKAAAEDSRKVSDFVRVTLDRFLRETKAS